MAVVLVSLAWLAVPSGPLTTSAVWLMMLMTMTAGNLVASETPQYNVLINAELNCRVRVKKIILVFTSKHFKCLNERTSVLFLQETTRTLYKQKHAGEVTQAHTRFDRNVSVTRNWLSSFHNKKNKFSFKFYRFFESLNNIVREGALPSLDC